jgi:rhamnosyl/mannosyltransferase
VRVVCVNHEATAGADVTWRTLASTPTVDEHDRDVRVTRLGRRASFSRLDVCPGIPTTLLALRREGVDVVHVHAPNPTMFGALALLPSFEMLVVTHHSDVVKQRVLGAAFAPIERVVHACAALILSDSESYIGGSPALQRAGTKVATLPLGLDLAPFVQPSERALAYAEKLRNDHAGQPIWLSVGRLVYYKGFFTALDALRELPGRLLIVGRGPLEAPLRARAAALGLSDRVVFMGYLNDDELAGAYRAANALWFPSNARSEGFGLSQVEAMASGCPVLNTAVPHSGVSWVSLHDETGLTVPIDDAPAFAGAARRLLDEPGLHARLAAGARARALREFDHMVMARRSLELYARAGARRAVHSAHTTPA